MFNQTLLVGFLMLYVLIDLPNEGKLTAPLILDNVIQYFIIDALF